MLKNKMAVIYGAGGGIGSAVARAFATAHATVLLVGRHRAPLDKLANEIEHAGGRAFAAEVDALDERAVAAHLERAVAEHGALDVSFNATGIPQPGIQGIPLTEVSVESFMQPVESYTRAHFITARAAARVMASGRGGALLVHTPNPAGVGTPLVGGMTVAWAGLEALTRSLSAELASKNVRAICLRTTGIVETPTIDVVYGIHGKALGIGTAQFRQMVESRTHRLASTTLAELTAAAVLAASDLGAALTGSTLNLTGGQSAD
jgi:NAD(P)-dependent dehydrogenase (short-subunit alcohol dehydrogenase family)